MYYDALSKEPPVRGKFSDSPLLNKEVREAFFGSMLEELGEGTLHFLDVSRMAEKVRESLSTLDLDAFFRLSKPISPGFLIIHIHMTRKGAIRHFS